MSMLQRYWRFAIFGAVFVAAGGALLLVVDPVAALLLGFDVAVLVFVAVVIGSLGGDNDEEMRRDAAANEPDRYILQIIAAVVVAVVVAAVGYQVTSGENSALAIASITLLLAWLFGNLLFALHYAHAFYVGREGGEDCAGLRFPGDEKQPDYWDFAYFAFVIGTAFAVSDIRIESKALRRVVLLHSMLAFWFNIGVVALTISLVSAAIG